MRDGSKIFLAKAARFGGVLILAFAISTLLSLTNFPRWAQAALIFAGTKVLADVGYALFRRERRFLYFEDYMRESLVYMVVAVVGILGVAAVERYMGGVVWVPILAAVLVHIWR